MLFCPSVRVRFVNIIGSDLDLWAFLWVALWWRLLGDTKGFSFSEFDLTILKPIWRQDPPRSVMCFCCQDCLSPPEALPIWTVTISWLCCCVNFLSLATELGVSFTVLLDLWPLNTSQLQESLTLKFGDTFARFETFGHLAMSRNICTLTYPMYVSLSVWSYTSITVDWKESLTEVLFLPIAK